MSPVSIVQWGRWVLVRSHESAIGAGSTVAPGSRAVGRGRKRKNPQTLYRASEMPLQTYPWTHTRLTPRAPYKIRMLNGGFPKADLSGDGKHATIKLIFFIFIINKVQETSDFCMFWTMWVHKNMCWVLLTNMTVLGSVGPSGGGGVISGVNTLLPIAGFWCHGTVLVSSSEWDFLTGPPVSLFIRDLIYMLILYHSWRSTQTPPGASRSCTMFLTFQNVNQ